jgi:hypothetical protein
MQRRLARQRKDYLYRKSLELQAAAQEQKKARLKRAVDSGSSVPTELRNEYHELAHELEMEDEATKEKKTVSPSPRDPPPRPAAAADAREPPRSTSTTNMHAPARATL